YYTRIRPAFSYCRVILSNTDSLYLEVSDPNYLLNLKSLSDIIDFSRLPAEHLLYNTNIKGEAGKFVMDNDYVVELLALQTGNYSMIFQDPISGNQNITKCVGIPRHIKESSINHEDYRKAIYEGQEKKVNFISVEQKFGCIK